MSDYFERVERQLVRGVEAGPARRWVRGLRLGHVAPAVAVVLVLIVAGAFLGLRGHSSRLSPAAGGSRLVFTALALDGRAAAPVAIDRSVETLRRRVATVNPGAQVSRAGADVIVVLKHPSAATRARVLALSAPGRLALYDWEADALTPEGRTVASRLSKHDPSATIISQGNGGAAPGSSGAGGLPLRQARSLAAKARFRHRVGTALLQAQRAGPSSNPTPARFYVLINRAALSGREVVDPRQSTDAAGAPDVLFGLTPGGRRAFRQTTSAVAHRGAIISGLGQTLDQHFAIALDGELTSVPSIDFKVYPDGISGGGEVDITGGFTVQSARDLATMLRFGPLGVRLTAR